MLPGEVEEQGPRASPGSDATVELVWDPPVAPDLMSEAARLQLGML